LLAQTGRVEAIEVDPWMVQFLRSKFGSDLTVLEGDFLRFDLPASPCHVVGNIPYSRSADIIRHLTGSPHPPRDAWLIVQREFAERLCGHPYTRESLWSLQLKPQWHVEIIERLARADFSPPPAVDSVLIWMQLRRRPLLLEPEAELYRSLLNAVFLQAPDNPQRALRRWLSKLQFRRLAEDLCFPGDAAPGEIGFVQWLGIVRFIQSSG
jgi:23S rRNA (adenine-N6)-dimethyltransferase